MTGSRWRRRVFGQFLRRHIKFPASKLRINYDRPYLSRVAAFLTSFWLSGSSNDDRLLFFSFSILLIASSSYFSITFVAAQDSLHAFDLHQIQTVSTGIVSLENGFEFYLISLYEREKRVKGSLVGNTLRPESSGSTLLYIYQDSIPGYITFYTYTVAAAYPTQRLEISVRKIPQKIACLLFSPIYIIVNASNFLLCFLFLKIRGILTYRIHLCYGTRIRHGIWGLYWKIASSFVA